MRLLIDSSALAKRYVEEPGSMEVVHCCQRADEIVLSILVAPEVLSGLNRLRTEGKLSKRTYAELKNELLEDLSEVPLVEVTAKILRNFRLDSTENCSFSPAADFCQGLLDHLEARLTGQHLSDFSGLVAAGFEVGE